MNDIMAILIVFLQIRMVNKLLFGPNLSTLTLTAHLHLLDSKSIENTMTRRLTWKVFDLVCYERLRFRLRYSSQIQLWTPVMVKSWCPPKNTRMKTITDSLDLDCITGLDASDS